MEIQRPQNRALDGAEPAMKVALYARVSTVDKDQNPETQLRLLREYAERMEWGAASYVD